MQKKHLNKKVKNATKVVIDEKEFKSKLEAYCYKKLTDSGLDFKYEGETFELIPPFEFNGDSYELRKKNGENYFGLAKPQIKAITYTPDFIGNDWIIETKGMPNDAFPLKWKLFKKYLHDNPYLYYDLYMPRNQQQVDTVINVILQKKYERLL